MEKTTLEIQSTSDLRHSIQANIAEHRKWYMLQDAVFILTGMLAIILPVATADGFELLIGALLLASSVTRAIASFRSRIQWWSLLSSVAAIVVGLFMLFYPILGTLVLATILAVFLILEGLTEALLPVQFRPARNWGWLRCN